jgi:hypothetical protein
MTLTIGKLLGIIPARARLMLTLSLAFLTIGGVLYWRYLHVQHRLEVCEQERALLQTEVALRDSHIVRLKNAVERQNRQVGLLRDISELRQAAVAEARRDLEDMRSRARADVKELERQEGTSCLDGIALLDKELGL